MKKNLFYVLIILLITACTSVEPKEYYKAITKEYQKPVSLVQVSILNTELGKNDYGWYTPKEINVSVKNLTDKTITIKWEESSINGNTIFKSGMKYIDAGKTIPNTIIFPNSFENLELYDSSKVAYNSSMGYWNIGFWSEKELPIKLIMTFEQDGKKEQYLVEIIKGDKIVIKKE